MAEQDTKISSLSELTSADNADELLVIDKSDTTDGLGGTGKKINVANLKSGLATSATVIAHISDTTNPHNVTKTQIGLGNVDNTSDLNKPISTATQAALDAKASSTHDHDATYAPVTKGVTNGDSHDHTGGDGAQIDHNNLNNKGTNTHTQIDQHIASQLNPHSVTVTQIGAVPTSDKGTANGVATLGSDGKIPSAQLPKLAVTNVYTASSEAAMLALTTEEGDVVVRTDQTKSYIKNTGTSGTMSDFTEIIAPTGGNINSVFSRTGNVVAQSGDYTASQITFTPVGNLAAETVQAALQELDTEKEIANANIQTHISDTNNPHSVTASQVGAVPSTRTVAGKALSSDITITANDLSDVEITSPSNGQVLKFNGTNWVNDTDATGGGSTSSVPRIVKTIDGSINALNDTTVFGALFKAASGTIAGVSYSASGYYQLTNTNTASGYAYIYASDNAVSFNHPANYIYIFNPTWVMVFTQDTFTAGVNATLYMGTAAASGALNFNSRQVGIKIIIEAGVATYYATCGNGTAETATDITSYFSTPSVQNHQRIVIEMTSGSSIKYYVNGSLAATHTTNIPADRLATNSWGTFETLANASNAATVFLYVYHYSMSYDAR